MLRTIILETRKIFYNFIIGRENSPCNGANHFCENHQIMKKTLVQMPKSGETLQNIPLGDLTSRRKIGIFLREETLSDNGSPKSACGIWLSDMIERKNILDREGRGVFPVGPQAIPLFDGGRIAWAGIMIPAGCFTGCGRKPPDRQRNPRLLPDLPYRRRPGRMGRHSGLQGHHRCGAVHWTMQKE